MKLHHFTTVARYPTTANGTFWVCSRNKHQRRSFWRSSGHEQVGADTKADFFPYIAHFSHPCLFGLSPGTSCTCLHTLPDIHCTMSVLLSCQMSSHKHAEHNWEICCINNMPELNSHLLKLLNLNFGEKQSDSEGLPEIKERIITIFSFFSIKTMEPPQEDEYLF